MFRKVGLIEGSLMLIGVYLLVKNAAGVAQVVYALTTGGAQYARALQGR